MKYAKLVNGTVRKYGVLPNTYENVINFRKASEQTKNSKGFFEVIEPSITQYQRLIPLDATDFSANKFEHRIYDFTQNEIDTLIQKNEDEDSVAVKNEKRKKDGEILHMRFWNKIERHLENGDISQNLYDALSIQLWDEVLPIKFGAWKIAKARVDIIPEPANAKALEILNFIKNKINDYIIDPSNY